MTKNIIVHHNDLDGCVSAAMLVRQILQKKDETYTLVPVMYLGNKDHHKRMLDDLIVSHFSGPESTVKNKVFVLDFPWHPMANVWIDHHKTSMSSAPENARKYLLPQLDSAAEAVAIYLSDNDPNYVESVNTTWALSWTGKIDSAKYESSDEYYNCDNPWLILRLLTDHDKQAHRTARIAELLAHNDMDAQKVVDIIGGTRKTVEKFQSDIKATEQAIVVNGSVGLIITRHRNDFPRYAEYICRPDINLSIRVTNLEGKREVRVGKNPWAPKNNIDIGAIMAEVCPGNGGGHPGVGGAIVDESEYHSVIDRILERVS